MFPITSLNHEQRRLCCRTLSPNAFYMLVGGNLKQKWPLSVVRMGDGEYHLMTQDTSQEWFDKPVEPYPGFDTRWLVKLGIDGISRSEVQNRLYKAAARCTFFAPSISGIQRENFNLYNFFPPREHYVDNFFVNAWTEAMILELFKAAGHVLLIHKNAHTADSMQLRLQGNGIAKVHFIKLQTWQQAEDVAKQAREIDAPLVLVSAGPGSKWIIPEIATSGRIAKVVLDIGNAMDRWIPQSLPVNRKAANEFHTKWVKNER